LITGALMLAASLAITLWAFRLSKAAPPLQTKVFTEQCSV
jgi:hypothetical protein